MTIRIDPHYRIRVLPNVGFARKDDAVVVFAELENTGEETISSANLVAVAYSEDGILCGMEESNSFLTLHGGERKALKLTMEVDPDKIAVIRLYAETEFDEDDPYEAQENDDPPGFMTDYFRFRTETPPKDG